MSEGKRGHQLAVGAEVQHRLEPGLLPIGTCGLELPERTGGQQTVDGQTRVRVGLENRGVPVQMHVRPACS